MIKRLLLVAALCGVGLPAGAQLVGPVGVGLSGPVLLGALTFATLPGTPVTGTIAYISDGKASNCGDAACTTWGTTVTGGTGALKLLIWYNSAGWTLIGK